MLTVPFDVPVILKLDAFSWSRLVGEREPRIFQFAAIVRGAYRDELIPHKIHGDLLASERFYFDMKTFIANGSDLELIEVLTFNELPLLVGWKYVSPLLEQLLRERI